MANTQLDSVIRHIRRLADAQNLATDAQLVDRFLTGGTGVTPVVREAAFATLLHRHGPMVLGVCRGVLGQLEDAEDVFQATFLVLARKAGAIRKQNSVASWLHGVAYRLAVRARAQRAVRRIQERKASTMRPRASNVAEAWRELRPLLDEEMAKLPEKHRAALVLCYWEAKTQEEAARELGCPLGTVRSRVARARQLLKRRLTRRGLTLSAGSFTALVAAGSGSAAVGSQLQNVTLKAALQFSAGKAASQIVSPSVALLVEAGMKGIFGPNLKIATVMLMVGGLALGGVGVAAHQDLTVKLFQAPPEAAKPVQSQPAAIAEKQKPTRTDLYGDPLPDGAVARLGSSRRRIGNSAFALTPDARTIVTVSPEGVLRKFDANTGQFLERRQLSDGSDVDPVGQYHAQLTPDGKTAAIYDRSDGGRRLTVWDLPSGKKVFRRESTEERMIGAHALSPDGKQLAVAETTEGNIVTLRVYDLKTGRTKELGNLEFNVYDIRFMGDARRLVVSQTSSKAGQPESTFACFDVAAGKQLWHVPRHAVEFAVSPDGRKLIFAAADQSGFQVIEIDPESGKPTESFKPFQGAHSNVRLVIAPDNRTVVMNHFDGIIVWDLQTGKEIRRFPVPETRGRGYGPELGAISLDSRTLITNLGYLQRWDLTTGKPLFEAPPDDGLGAAIERLAFTPDGKEVFASSWYLNSGRWNVKTGNQISLTRNTRWDQLLTTPDGIRALKWGDRHNDPQEITLFEPVAGKPLSTVTWAKPKEVGVNGLMAYALTADGKTFLVVHRDEPSDKGRKSYVTACDIRSGRRLARFSVPTISFQPNSPFSPCGRWVVLAGKVYHVASGTELFTPSGERGERLLWIEGPWRSDHLGKGSVWFSDDGRLLAGHLRKAEEQPEAAETLAVWELASGKVLARFPKARWVSQVAFAPNGRTIALLDGQGIRIEDLLIGNQLASYPALDVPCYLTVRGSFKRNLVFSPDGLTLATGHQDGTILLWKVAPSPLTRPDDISDAAAEKLWVELGSSSPSAAREAMERLASRPAVAVTLMTAKFSKIVTPADPALAALVKNLDSDAFATRERASQKLREFGTKAEAALQDALAGSPSLEMKRRIEEILAVIPPALLRLPLSGDALRWVRAIEVLEHVGTPEARQLLRSLSKEASEASLVQEARASSDRLHKRASQKP